MSLLFWLIIYSIFLKGRMDLAQGILLTFIITFCIIVEIIIYVKRIPFVRKLITNIENDL